MFYPFYLVKAENQFALHCHCYHVAVKQKEESGSGFICSGAAHSALGSYLLYFKEYIGFGAQIPFTTSMPTMLNHYQTGRVWLELKSRALSKTACMGVCSMCHVMCWSDRVLHTDMAALSGVGLQSQVTKMSECKVCCVCERIASAILFRPVSIC